MWMKLKTFLQYKLMGLYLVLIGISLMYAGFLFGAALSEQNMGRLSMLLIALSGFIIIILGMHEFNMSSIEQNINEKLLILYKELEIKKR